MNSAIIAMCLALTPRASAMPRPVSPDPSAVYVASAAATVLPSSATMTVSLPYTIAKAGRATAQARVEIHGNPGNAAYISLWCDGALMGDIELPVVLTSTAAVHRHLGQFLFTVPGPHLAQVRVRAGPAAVNVDRARVQVMVLP